MGTGVWLRYFNPHQMAMLRIRNVSLVFWVVKAKFRRAALTENIGKRRVINMSKARSKSSKAGTWAIIYCVATDKFLFGKRSGAVRHAGAWNLFGGRVERGEAPCRALVRELAEEAGLQVKAKQLRKLRRVAPVKNAGNRDLHYYLLKIEREVAPQLNREHSHYGWFKRDELPVMFNFPTTVAIKKGLLHNVKS